MKYKPKLFGVNHHQGYNKMFKIILYLAYILNSCFISFMLNILFYYAILFTYINKYIYIYIYFLKRVQICCLRSVQDHQKSYSKLPNVSIFSFILTESVRKLSESLQKLLIFCKVLLRKLFLLVSWNYNLSSMWNLEKPVPSTDEMSCTVNIKSFQIRMFWKFWAMLFKSNFTESINLITFIRTKRL